MQVLCYKDIKHFTYSNYEVYVQCMASLQFWYSDCLVLYIWSLYVKSQVREGSAHFLGRRYDIASHCSEHSNTAVPRSTTVAKQSDSRLIRLCC